MRRIAIILAIACLLAGCNRSGLSRHFRSEAKDALSTFHRFESQKNVELAAVDRAVAKAKAKAANAADLQTADVLDWYAILLHRLNRARTENWRRICSAEVEMRLQGANSARAQLPGGAAVPVEAGDCQTAAMRMMAEDAERPRQAQQLPFSNSR